MIKQRQLAQSEYRLDSSSGRLVVEVHNCREPRFADDVKLELKIYESTLGKVELASYKFEALSLSSGALNSKAAIPFSLEPGSMVTLILSWDTANAGDRSEARLDKLAHDIRTQHGKVSAMRRDQLRAAQKLAAERERSTARELKNLRETRDAITSSWVYYCFGYGMETVLDLTIQIKRLEGTLDELKEANQRLVNSWQYTGAVVVSEMSPVGSYSRIVDGKTLTGEPVSDGERALELITLGIGLTALAKVRRTYKIQRLQRTKVPVPDLCADIAERLSLRRKTLTKSATKTYSKVWQRGSAKPSGRVLDGYAKSDLRNLRNKLRLRKLDPKRKYQSWVTARIDDDGLVTIQRTVGDGATGDILYRDVIAGKDQNLYNFVLHCLEPSPNPQRKNLFYGGCHHADVPSIMRGKPYVPKPQPGK